SRFRKVDARRGVLSMLREIFEMLSEGRPIRKPSWDDDDLIVVDDQVVMMPAGTTWVHPITSEFIAYDGVPLVEALELKSFRYSTTTFTWKGNKLMANGEPAVIEKWMVKVRFFPC